MKSAEPFMKIHGASQRGRSGSPPATRDPQGISGPDEPVPARGTAENLMDIARLTHAHPSENALAADPTAPNPNAAALKGGLGFCLRVGDWRVLYVVESPEKLLRVAAILSRGEAYR